MDFTWQCLIAEGWPTQFHGEEIDEHPWGIAGHDPGCWGAGLGELSWFPPTYLNIEAQLCHLLSAAHMLEQTACQEKKKMFFAVPISMKIDEKQKGPNPKETSAFEPILIMHLQIKNISFTILVI